MTNEKKIEILEKENKRLLEQNEHLKSVQKNVLMSEIANCSEQNIELTKQLKEIVAKVLSEKRRIVLNRKKYEKKISRLFLKVEIQRVKNIVTGR